MGDTIAAAATGNVRSAIGIIRLSGDGAIECADRVFRAKSGRKMADAPSGRLVYGGAYGPEGELLDMCLCTVSRAPRSYTGEDTAEIQCHGSPVVISLVLSALFAAGARQALPGEFTKRAFLNGRMDLTGAEAVIDLIDAQTGEAAKNAAGQLAGAVTKKTDEVYSKLLDMAAHFHAVVDWPDEDIDEFELEGYIKTLEEAEGALSALLDTFARGRVLREGVRCAIVGRPNVGKSSLLNALVGFDRAIVTDIAGTTRDTVEEKCVVGGVLLRLTDTAGIRETEDAVESMGVRRSLEAISSADMVIAVVDAARGMSPEDGEVLSAVRAAGKPWILAVNKVDAAGEVPAPDARGAAGTVDISALTGEGIDELGDMIAGIFKGKPVPQGEILTNARQAGEVARARDAVARAREAAASGMTPDAVLLEIEDAMDALGALTGRTLREDVTNRIFERFCVGK